LICLLKKDGKFDISRKLADKHWSPYQLTVWSWRDKILDWWGSEETEK